ncbi:Uncharacterised protein [Mycobacteroides abscessus subsp. abscessus]|nr:Uncharacterised protein [Mycobacteroides abscessus subsp. abscessus]
MRSVDDDERRTVGHRGLERLPVGSESALGLEHRHGDELTAGRRDRSRVGVVVRFERHDPASRGDEGEDRRGQPLRGPTRDEHLLGGDRMAEVLRPSARDRLAEDRVSLPGGVLVEALAHGLGRRLDERRRRIRARSTLAEVDRPRRRRQLRHLAVDRLRELPVGTDESCRVRHLVPEHRAGEIRPHSATSGATRPRASSTRSWRRPFVATALPPKTPGTPAVFVKVPPASRTIGASAPMS